MKRRSRVTSKSRTVLIVDDDGALIEVQQILLAELGFQVVTCTSAEKAIEILKSDDAVDLLLTDLGLPGMNGWQLAEIARTMHPELPVLFVTGYANPPMFEGKTLPEGMRMFVKAAPIDEFYSVLKAVFPDGAAG